MPMLIARALKKLTTLLPAVVISAVAPSLLHAQTSYAQKPIAGDVAAIPGGNRLSSKKIISGAAPLSRAPVTFVWKTVVNNNVTVPGDTRKFNSYNQPSVNVKQLVVFRARSKGGTTGEPAHGVFTRDMAKTNAPIVTIFDRNTLVPQPNNLDSTFTEPPSFPRIDIWSNTIASRGNHQPVWEYMLPDGTESRAGTTGIYTDPFGDLIAGASNLGAVPDFGFFAVPGTDPPIKFDVFPGAPAVTDVSTIVFKGNYTVPDPNNPDQTISKTGVYFRNLTNEPIPLPDSTDLSPAGGTNPVVPIADTDTTIPGTSILFGSTAPPSAALGEAVFAGFDNEDAPTAGGIYMAPLSGAYPPLTTLASIGEQVPGESSGAVFNKLGEGVSFDGRFVAFWGAWGSDSTTLVLQCVNEGNAARVAYCKREYPNGFTTTVPVHQGIFVYDTVAHSLSAVAKAPTNFSDFVYWNFSGLVPDTSEADEAGEPARWRSSEFVAVSGLVDDSLRDRSFHVAFKARTGEVVDGEYVNPVDGIYFRRGPGNTPTATVVQTGTNGTLIDPQAVDPDTGAPLPVTSMGVERDGFRGNSLVINVSMGTEEAGWAGIYMTTVR